MTDRITDVMSVNPITLQNDDTAQRAAQMMRDNNVGDVLIMDGELMCGVVTDRDITTRVVAEGKMADSVLLGDICSRDLITLASTNTVDDAIYVMREHAIRRLPIMEHNRPIGIVSLGDLAIERDPQSVLGTVSAAPATH